MEHKYWSVQLYVTYISSPLDTFKLHFYYYNCSGKSWMFGAFFIGWKLSNFVPENSEKPWHESNLLPLFQIDSYAHTLEISLGDILVTSSVNKCPAKCGYAIRHCSFRLHVRVIAIIVTDYFDINKISKNLLINEFIPGFPQGRCSRVRNYRPQMSRQYILR